MTLQVRTQDGLLQRFLNSDKTYGKAKQGDMRRYWYDGNSEQYIYLLYQMQQLECYREKRGQNNNDGSGDDDDNPLEAAEAYFRSFDDQAEGLWDVIVSPFSKESRDDLKDFLANGSDEEEEDDQVPQFMFDKEQIASDRQHERAMAARYEHLAGEHHSSGDEDEDDVHIPNGMQEDSEESEADDWVAGIRNKGIRNKQRRASMPPDEKKPKGRLKISASRAQKDDASDDGSMDQALAEPSSSTDKHPPSSGKKRVILEDSDSD